MAGETPNDQMDDFLKSSGATPVDDTPNENPDAGNADATAVVTDPTPGGQPQTRVAPIAALDEERSRRKELEEQVRLSQERVARMEGAFQAIMQRQQQPQQQAEQLPDFETQPADYLKAKLDRLEQATGGMAFQQQQLVQAQRMQAEMMQATMRAEADFRAAKPDYPQALDYMRQATRKELEVLYGPANAEQALQMQESQFAAQQIASGRNPAEVIYNLAIARGWQPGQPAQDPNAQKLQQLAAAQAANKSLSGAQGGLDNKGNGAPKTLEELAQYEGDDFDKAFDAMMKNSRSSMDGLFH